MPKQQRPTPKYTFTFAIVEYQSYTPFKYACRYYRHVEGFGSIFRETKTWDEIFAELKDFHPGVKFEIPDPMPIIRYDKDHRLIED